MYRSLHIIRFVMTWQIYPFASICITIINNTAGGLSSYPHTYSYINFEITSRTKVFRLKNNFLSIFLF